MTSLPHRGPGCNRPHVVPDSIHVGMFRAVLGGQLTDMVNLARANDAVACYVETEARRLRGRQTPAGASPVRQSMPDVSVVASVARSS
jgi:hypothetical protein